MANSKQILVVGGGPAGVHASLAAAREGCNVILVADGPPGGRAAWQTLLPSKMWLEASGNRGIQMVASSPVGLHLGDVLQARYEQIAWAWQRQLSDELERAGVEIRLGTASFLSPHEIQVVPPEGGYNDQLPADAMIIATGAVPFVPPGLQADGVRVFSPQTIWQMKELPESMVVIGAGGPATEYVDVFSRLGVKIIWITGPVGVLSAFPPEAGRSIAMMLERRGVKIITGLMARQMEHYEDGIKVTTADGSSHEAKIGFVAIGMRPDFERLNLPAAGLRPGSSGGLATDPYGRTAVPHIYLVGDAASPLSANISMAQGRVAGWHAAGLEVAPLLIENAVMAIYTDPQVAMVGRLTDRSEPLQHVRIPFSVCLKAHLIQRSMHASEMEFLDIAYDGQRRITGALAIGPEAAEVLTPIAIAVRAGMTLDMLAGVFPAHPTFSELSILAARAAR